MTNYIHLRKRKRKRRRGVLSLLPVVIALLFVTKSATTAAEEGKRKGPQSKLESDVVDERATKAQRMTDEDRLAKTPKELMRDVHKARQSLSLIHI